ncbi:MAG: iron-sulfur cluster insertion protein ErpA [Alphaproteobacteria bacterium]
MAETAPNTRPGVTITDSAARRVAKLIAEDGETAIMLRVSVSGGGCQGFQYGFTLDDAVNSDDRIFEKDGVKFVVDEISLGLIDGAAIDYKDELVGAYFAIDNPNATSSCGCGISFSI